MNLIVNEDEDPNNWGCLAALEEEFNIHGISHSVNFACGFFTAVLSFKDRIPTQDWISPFMNESSADSVDSANKLLQAMFSVYNKIAMQLYDDKFEPSLLESMKAVGWHEGSEKSITEWCFGYCNGVDLKPSVWLKEQYEYSLPIAIFGGAIEITKDDPMTNEELEDLTTGIPDMAQSVYNIAFDVRGGEIDFKPQTNKLGRNDPCFCGSGKKYKKCCLDGGKAGTIH